MQSIVKYEILILANTSSFNCSFVDIWTCDLLVRLVKFAFPQFEFMWLANEMKINLPQELAFTKEAINAEKASRIFKEFDWIKVPVISWDLTTDRVLVMEFCSGCHINDLPGLHRQGVDPYEVSSKLGQMYSKMIFDEGYVHCDPHPGNLLVNKDKSGRTQIVLLDHGLYTQLTNQFRYQYSDFWRAVINRDVPAIRLSADKLGVGNLAELFACMVTARSWSSVQRGLDVAPRTKAEGEEIKANLIKYFNEIAAVLAGVNRQMILIFKTNDLLRGKCGWFALMQSTLLLFSSSVYQSSTESLPGMSTVLCQVLSLSLARGTPCPP